MNQQQKFAALLGVITFLLNGHILLCLKPPSIMLKSTGHIQASLNKCAKLYRMFTHLCWFILAYSLASNYTHSWQVL